MVRLTLKQSAYFIAVADEGGIAHAARALNISQPAVAQAIDKLEGLYGFRLFLRHHARGMELTPQGRAFYRAARNLLAESERAEREALAIAADRAGIIRFACFHTIAPFYLSGIVKRHGALFPDIRIEAQELQQDGIVAQIEEGDLDLALTYDMSLDGGEFYKETLVGLRPFVLLGADHALAAQPQVRLADLADYPFVMFDGPYSRDYFKSLLAAHGIDPPIALNAGSIESVRCAVANGLGFSLSVMAPCHAETYDGGRIVHVPIADPTDPLAIVLLSRKGVSASAIIDAFADTCRIMVENEIGRS